MFSGKRLVIDSLVSLGDIDSKIFLKLLLFFFSFLFDVLVAMFGLDFIAIR